MKDADKSIEQLDAEIAKVEAERAELFIKQKLINDGLLRTHQRIRELNELRSQRKIAEGSYTWEELLHETGYGVDMVRYHECYRRLHELGLSTTGYIPTIQQKQIQISVPHDADAATMAKIKSGIETVLPFLKQFDDDYYDLDGVVAFEIITEATLSEYGIYNARFQASTGKWFLCKTAYRQRKIKGEYDSLEEFLLTLKVSHPYPADERVDYDYDDDY